MSGLKEKLDELKILNSELIEKLVLSLTVILLISVIILKIIIIFLLFFHCLLFCREKLSRRLWLPPTELKLR